MIEITPLPKSLGKNLTRGVPQSTGEFVAISKQMQKQLELLLQRISGIPPEEVPKYFNQIIQQGICCTPEKSHQS